MITALKHLSPPDSAPPNLQRSGTTSCGCSTEGKLRMGCRGSGAENADLGWAAFWEGLAGSPA